MADFDRFTSEWVDEGDLYVVREMVAPTLYITALANALYLHWNDNINIEQFPSKIKGVDKILYEWFKEALFSWTPDLFANTFKEIIKVYKRLESASAIKRPDLQIDKFKVELQTCLINTLFSVVNQLESSDYKFIEDCLLRRGCDFIMRTIPCYSHLFGNLSKRLFTDKHGLLQFMRHESKLNEKEHIDCEFIDSLFAETEPLPLTSNLHTEAQKEQIKQCLTFTKQGICFDYGIYDTKGDFLVAINKKGHLSKIFKDFTRQS